MSYFLFFLFLLIVFLLNTQYRVFTFPYSKLRVLEYHSISTNGFEDQVTISKEKIIQQLEYLKRNNFTTLWFSDLEKYQENKQKLPKKSIILTFDDGYLDNYTELFPLLQKYQMKAVCFMVLGRMGQTVDWGGEFADHSQYLMTSTQLKETTSHIEYGYHTFKHDNYSLMSFHEIEEDIKKCKEVAEKEQLPIYPALAYTYGRYFRKKDEKQNRFFSILKKIGFKYGIRIGNRMNTFPFKNPYEVQRIDIRGQESMQVFKWKVWVGRIRPF